MVSAQFGQPLLVNSTDNFEIRWIRNLPRWWRLSRAVFLHHMALNGIRLSGLGMGEAKPNIGNCHITDNLPARDKKRQ